MINLETQIERNSACNLLYDWRTEALELDMIGNDWMRSTLFIGRKKIDYAFGTHIVIHYDDFILVRPQGGIDWSVDVSGKYDYLFKTSKVD